MGTGSPKLVDVSDLVRMEVGMAGAVWVQMVAVLVALGAVFFQLRKMQQRMNFDHRLHMRSKALSYSLFSNEHLRDSRVNIEKHFGSNIKTGAPIPSERIDCIIRAEGDDSNNHLYSDIMTLLAHWENMALAIHKEVADEDTAREMVGATLIRHVEIFDHFIRARQGSNRRAYRYLLPLKQRWEQHIHPYPDPDPTPVQGR